MKSLSSFITEMLTKKLSSGGSLYSKSNKKVYSRSSKNFDKFGYLNLELIENDYKEIENKFKDFTFFTADDYAPEIISEDTRKFVCLFLDQVEYYPDDKKKMEKQAEIITKKYSNGEFYSARIEEFKDQWYDTTGSIDFNIKFTRSKGIVIKFFPIGYDIVPYKVEKNPQGHGLDIYYDQHNDSEEWRTSKVGREMLKYT